ncbi:odorant receptor 13a-like [Anticarsia gemmatalis]|uniref:odorant receptor 13a-like n=1 Tax=Anticarsia gemmatalis TaxID=129554 RepID=UPI003F76EF54
MTKTLDLRFEELFKISTMSLRVNRSHPAIVRDKFWKIQYSLIFGVSLFCFVNLLYSVLCHDIKSGRFAEASKNCTMVIVSVTINLKYMSLLRHQESVKEMIKYVEEDYKEDNDYSEEDRETVLNYANRGTNVCKFWLVAGFGTTIIFPLKSFVLMGYSYWQGEMELVPLFDLTYIRIIDDYKNVPVVFCILYVICSSFGLYASTMYVGFDPIVPIFMLHICGQLQLLSRRLSKIFVEADNPVVIQRQLKMIIIKLQSLYKLTDTIKANFSVLFEYNMKATTFLLPLTAFQLVEDMRNHRLNIEFMSFLGACFLHFFVPCYYSDLLMEESENFRQAIYSSGWEKCPDKGVRQTILFMITRAKILMGIRTVFYEINLDTFAEMCRQSYTLLNLMNAAWG